MGTCQFALFKCHAKEHIFVSTSWWEWPTADGWNGRRQKWAISRHLLKNFKALGETLGVTDFPSSHLNSTHSRNWGFVHLSPAKNLKYKMKHTDKAVNLSRYSLGVDTWFLFWLYVRISSCTTVTFWMSWSQSFMSWAWIMNEFPRIFCCMIQLIYCGAMTHQAK